MKKILHRTMAVLLLLMLIFPLAGAGGNDFYNEKISELMKQAEDDHMRFIELPESGYNAEIAKDIQTNDHKMLEETPTGSIKVTVLDADTNMPVKDAMVLLTATLNYYSTAGGVSTQTANAFLAVNLGQTGGDGICLYQEPLFYHDDDDIINDDGTMKTDYLDYLSVGIANVDISTAKICLLPIDENDYLSEEAKSILAALDPNGVWTYDEFLAAISKVPGIEKADLAVDDLLDDDIAAYTDDTVVKLYKETDQRLAAFSGIGDAEGKITFGELKNYIQNNHPLLTDKIVGKYYRSIAGYTPTFKVSGSAEVQETIIYKDGTSEVQTDSARIYLDLFEDQEGGTGLAYISSGFSYRAYAYHPDYTSGKTKGTSVRQYLNAADQELVILLSKDTPPVSINSQRTTVYGQLTGSDGSPLAGARITSENGSLSGQSDSEGFFTLSISEPGAYVLKITPANTAATVSGSVSINGGDFSDKFSITVGAEPARYHVNWYQKGYDLSKAIKGSAAPGKSLLLPILIISATLVALVVLIIVLAGRKKRRQVAAIHATIPGVARICPGCQNAAQPGTRFCSRCGRQME